MWFLVKQLSPKIHVPGRIKNFSAGVVRLQLNLLKLNTLVNVIGCAHAYAYGLYLENVGSNQKKIGSFRYCQQFWVIAYGFSVKELGLVKIFSGPGA